MCFASAWQSVIKPQTSSLHSAGIEAHIRRRCKGVEDDRDSREFNISSGLLSPNDFIRRPAQVEMSDPVFSPFFAHHIWRFSNGHTKIRNLSGVFAGTSHCITAGFRKRFDHDERLRPRIVVCQRNMDHRLVACRCNPLQTLFSPTGDLNLRRAG